MIPLKDRNPTSSFPVVSVSLILVNVVVFILDRLHGSYAPVAVKTARGVVRSWEFTGAFTPKYALVPAELLSSFPTEWITVFSSMFLHGNWLHIGSNMLYLWIFGDNIEDRLGKLKFLLFYFFCGAAAAGAQFFQDPHSTLPMVGASGAVAGIMGAYILLYPRAMVLTLVPIFFFFTYFDIPAFVIIGYWALLQFLNVVFLDGAQGGGGVAYFAHAGGFVAGLVAMAIVARKGPGGRRRGR